MIGMVAIVAGVVFFILVARRLTAGSSGDNHGVSGDADTIWSWNPDLTDHGSTEHHSSGHDHGSSGWGDSSDSGWSWGSSDGSSSWDSSSSSDSGSSSF